MSTTLVTSLYDIGRGTMKGRDAHRPFDKYLGWFKHLLSINVPMVIFIPDYLQKYVAEHRPKNYKTKIIGREFEQLDAYKNYHDKMQETIDSMVKEPPFEKSFSTAPEFMSAKYETIIFSKFDFLDEVSSSNPFDTTYFIWLDAGTFYTDPPFDTSLEWPDPHKIRILAEDKFLIPNISIDPEDRSPLENKRAFLRGNKNSVCTFCLGGTREAIKRTHKRFWTQVDEALEMGVINNEQNISQLLFLENPQEYYLYFRTRRVHAAMSLPLADRMIPYELARGTKMNVPYRLNSGLKIISTMNPKTWKPQIKKWKRSALYLGYDFDIIPQKNSQRKQEKQKERDENVKLIYKQIKNIPHPHVAITTCDDSFFCFPSAELQERFTNSGVSVIVDDMCDRISTTSSPLPNLGKFFMIGRTSDVIRIFRHYLGKQDIPVQVTGSRDDLLVGNIRPREVESGRWEYDYDKSLYKSSLYNTYPCILRFSSGAEWRMSRFYENVRPFSELGYVQDDSQDGVLTISIILVILSGLALMVFISLYLA